MTVTSPTTFHQLCMAGSSGSGCDDCSGTNTPLALDGVVVLDQNGYQHMLRTASYNITTLITMQTECRWQKANKTHRLLQLIQEVKGLVEDSILESIASASAHTDKRATLAMILSLTDSKSDSQGRSSGELELIGTRHANERASGHFVFRY